MLISRRELILRKAAELMIGTPAGANVFRSRADALAREVSPAIVIAWSQDEPLEVTTAGIERRLELQIQVIARGPTPDRLADPTLVSAHAKLMADRTLGGLAFDVGERTTFLDMVSADEDVASIVVNYEVHYRTASQALDQAI